VKKSDRMSVADYKRSVAAKVPTEEEECTWLFEWAQLTRWNGQPISNVLVHVPNGAYLGADPKTRGITMGKLKAMGLQPGVFDYLIPVPLMKGHTIVPGLWLEMKRTKGGTVSTDQKEFRIRMQALGWDCVIAWGWIEASKIIESYLNLKEKP
jgi:hypothetical protein